MVANDRGGCLHLAGGEERQAVLEQRAVTGAAHDRVGHARVRPLATKRVRQRDLLEGASRPGSATGGTPGSRGQYPIAL